jgi:hypothetical protein
VYEEDGDVSVQAPSSHAAIVLLDGSINGDDHVRAGLGSKTSLSASIEEGCSFGSGMASCFAGQLGFSQRQVRRT